MRILDMDTGMVDALDIIGASPRWSPAADWIAYILGEEAGPLKVMRSDGSDQRQVSQGLARYMGGLDWSPDGEWVIVRNFDTKRLHIIHVSTGLSLPLPYTERLLHPTWRPDVPGG
jgi:Tol biopolymer transport system component